MASGKTIYISVKEAEMITDRILAYVWGEGTKKQERIAKHLMDKMDDLRYGPRPGNK